MNPGTPGLLKPKSIIHVGQAWVGKFNDGGHQSPSSISLAPGWSSAYGWYAFGNNTSQRAIGSSESYTNEPFLDPSVSSFTGGSLGTKSNFQANTQQSYNSLGNVCVSGTTIKSIPFGIGSFRLA